VSAHHWQSLREHGARLRAQSLQDVIAADPRRASAEALRVGPVYANFARQHLDAPAFAALLALAADRDVDNALRQLFAGAEVNRSERRPALHTALRGDPANSAIARAAHAQAGAARAQMDRLHEQLAAGPLTDIVSVGIGGSDLGPRLAADALKDFADGRFRVHFLTNVDGSAAQHLLRSLDPALTAAILVSKSFNTQETLLNGAILRDWLGDSERLYAVSANTDRAVQFGVAAERVLPMWDWVGGRYSLWSAVGFAVQLAIGRDGFADLLAGAAAMDAHVLGSPAPANLAVRHALTAVWNRVGLGLPTQAVLPYDERLALLPAYLQQLVMESLGKRVQSDGAPLDVASVPVLWGGAGTNSQHSFFQALHQGTDIVPAEFIGVVRPAHPYMANHAALLANLLAQAQALANGHGNSDPQRMYPGGRPSTMLLLDELTPESLGMLLALYEHSVYVQGVLLGINPFDQWGVELGKQIAGELLPALTEGGEPPADPVTRALLSELWEAGG
jgi:glucose-6-phosphate isomerase